MPARAAGSLRKDALSPFLPRDKKARSSFVCAYCEKRSARSCPSRRPDPASNLIISIAVFSYH